MIHVVGNVLNPVITKEKMVIAHLGNNELVLGAGVAGLIRKRWPLVQDSVRSNGSHNHRKGEMGWNDYIDVELEPDGPTVTISTMIAQTLKNRFPISMPALEDCIAELDDYATKAGAQVHIPRIGCGLARGRWEDIRQLIPSSWMVYTLPQEVSSFPAEAYLKPSDFLAIDK